MNFISLILTAKPEKNKNITTFTQTCAVKH